jgi:hypothetical protein
MNIHVWIERLILDGINVGPGQVAKVKAAVEAELSRVLTESGAKSGLQASGAFPEVPARSIRVDEEVHPTHLGRQVAKAVYGSICQGRLQRGPADAFRSIRAARAENAERLK